MTNGEIIKEMPEDKLAEFLFKWQIICGAKMMEMKFNELLNAFDVRSWLESKDNTIINNIMQSEWGDAEIDFTPFITE